MRNNVLCCFIMHYFPSKTLDTSYLCYDKPNTRVPEYCVLLRIFFRNAKIASWEKENKKVYTFDKVPVLIERNAISNHRNKKHGANVTPQYLSCSRSLQYFFVRSALFELFSSWQSDRGVSTTHVHVIRSHTCVRTWFLIVRRAICRYEL